jgi:uncharacterized protein (DUF305 family)
MATRSKIFAGAAVAAVLTVGAGTAALAIGRSGAPFTSGHPPGAGMMGSGMFGEMGQMGSGQMGSGQMGSGQMGSGQMGSGQMGSGQMGSGQMGSGQMGSMARARVDSEFGYLTEMIPHHQEAIAAAQQLLARSDRPEMKAFATSIIQTQSAQVDQMKADLARWYPGRDTTANYAPMMRDLSQLSGDALDRAFLEDMIPHHGMAVMMSEQLLSQHMAQHDEVTQLATTIRDGQHAEIVKMMGWLGSWFGESVHGQR